MTDSIENLVLEHLKPIQVEQTPAREHDLEILVRLSSVESGVARLARDEASIFTEIVQDRHTVDKRKARLERIERRLEILS